LSFVQFLLKYPVMRLLIWIGKKTIFALRYLGAMFLFLVSAIVNVFIPPFKFRYFVRQLNFFGNRSLTVVILIAFFTGMVLGLQGYYTLRKFGAESMLGAAVAISIIRELGPVLTALMVTGRAGSALTAEIGIMKITEQIDAILAMALNPVKYLVVPNILAAVVAFPLLTSIFDVTGIYSGYFISSKLLGLGKGVYFSQIERIIVWKDIEIGLVKAFTFGLLVSWVCCWKGYTSGHGAKGVSKATTEAVVLSSVLILVADYIIGTFYL